MEAQYWTYMKPVLEVAQHKELMFATKQMGVIQLLVVEEVTQHKQDIQQSVVEDVMMLVL
jgi:hypothetical protein